MIPDTKQRPAVGDPPGAVDKQAAGEAASTTILRPRPVNSEYRRAVANSASACAERRARVLAHPDVAIMLTWPPLSFPSPELWTGYVPPAWGPWGSAVRRQRQGRRGQDLYFDDIDDVANDAPEYLALLEVGHALREREAAGDAP